MLFLHIEKPALSVIDLNGVMAGSGLPIQLLLCSPSGPVKKKRIAGNVDLADTSETVISVQRRFFHFFKLDVGSCARDGFVCLKSSSRNEAGR
ncbi:hypothetical protein [Paenibacillus harenae]|nr:hypothetical protein [Paenibacillus harenae]